MNGFTVTQVGRPVMCRDHGIEFGRCSVCTELVWVSSDGDRFHNKEACKALRQGQAKARRKGKWTKPPYQKKRGILPERRQPCLVCYRGGTE